MPLNVGDVNARASDPRATSVLINVDEANGQGFLLNPLFGLLLKEVSGTVRRLPMRTVWTILTLRKVHLGIISNSRVAKGTAISCLSGGQSG